MSSESFSGEIKGRIVEVRFASSGKVALVLKRKGDRVKKNDLVASQDKKSLQAELDKQLGDFEKVRAEFEIFNLQKGEPADDITKYLKSQKQAQLNISVKEVELAKARLDQADLFSPIEGIIINDSNLVAGIYITPSSNPIKIIDTSSYFFEFKIEQKDIENFSESKKAEVSFEGLPKTYSGTTNPIVPSEKGDLLVSVKLDYLEGLIFGLKGNLTPH